MRILIIHVVEGKGKTKKKKTARYVRIWFIEILKIKTNKKTTKTIKTETLKDL